LVRALFLGGADGYRAINRLIENDRTVIEIGAVFKGAAVRPAIKIKTHQAIGKGIRLCSETVAATGILICGAALLRRHGGTADKQTRNPQQNTQLYVQSFALVLVTAKNIIAL